MNLSRQIVRTLFTAELRMVLRDRRILLTSILLPILIMPLRRSVMKNAAHAHATRQAQSSPTASHR